MPASKGTRPPAAGKGRPKGTRNKLSTDVKSMILAALNGVGGQAYLEEQAQKNPVAFMTLLGKVLPTTLQGDPESPIEHSLRVVYVKPKLVDAEIPAPPRVGNGSAGYLATQIERGHSPGPYKAARMM